MFHKILFLLILSLINSNPSKSAAAFLESEKSLNSPSLRLNGFVLERVNEFLDIKSRLSLSLTNKNYCNNSILFPVSSNWINIYKVSSRKLLYIVDKKLVKMVLKMPQSAIDYELIRKAHTLGEHVLVNHINRFYLKPKESDPEIKRSPLILYMSLYP